jgi:hypothetical protein
VLVFPHNEDQMHWSVTFAFNAGFVREKLDAVTTQFHLYSPAFFGTAVPFQMGHAMFQLTLESFGF